MKIHGTLAGFLILGFTSTSAFAGLTFTQITTVDGKRTAVTKMSADGGNAKMEIVEGPDNPFMPPGSYMLFTDGEMLMVNPTARTYSRFDTSMLEGAGEMAAQMEITDVVFEKVTDEPGESIDGYPTRHYEFKSSWKMGMQGVPMKTEFSSVEEVWTTTALEIPAVAGGAPALGGSLQGLTSALGENQALRHVEGFPLKHVTSQQTKINMGAMGALGGLGARLGGRMMGGGGGGGGGGATKTTMETTDIEQVDVPAATFEVPAGYQETQMFQTGPAMPSLNSVEEAPSVPNLNDLDE
jgi:hypothetical protein